jgi:hypothetical protein
VLNQLNTDKKKNSDADFRLKYKTEKCKFWEVGKECKFGESVKYIKINKTLVCFRPWVRRYKK